MFASLLSSLLLLVYLGNITTLDSYTPSRDCPIESNSPLCRWNECYPGYEDPSATSFLKLLHKQNQNFEEHSVKNTHHINVEYDFIVVGGGSAGSIVSNRLTENPGWQVLLIEAGGEQPHIADIPAKLVSLWNSEVNWKYKTVPQKHACLAYTNRQCSLPCGKVLGGGSVVNAMFYIRGNKRDYDMWESLGNLGWSYKDVLPYFLKSEDNQNKEYAITPYHSTGGYQPIQRFPHTDTNAVVILKAVTELGIPVRDYNGESQIGVMLAQSTSFNGERYSTAKSFLRPIRNRPNLHISLKSFVAKILIDQKYKKAYGVEFYREGKFYSVLARKEVILSAGSIRSPQLLMLSGIGPEKHLKEHGISVIHNLRVGYNFHDHVTSMGLFFSLNKTATYPVHEDQRACDEYNYLLNRKGPLASIGPAQVIAFLQAEVAGVPQDYPDVKLAFAGTIENEDRFQEPLSYYDEIVVAPVYLRPRSRGTIRLNSNNPWDYPLIDPNYLEHSSDIQKLVEGMKIGLKLGETQAFKDIGAKLIESPLSECTEQRFGTSNYFKCVAQYYTTSFKHPVGSCKMGPSKDRNAVVDSQLRVHGIQNLRVIDASIMPSIVSGHTNAPTMMIAEKGSDLVKSHWSSKLYT